MKRQGIGTKLFEYTVQEVLSSGLELGAIRLTLLCFIMWSLWIKLLKYFNEKMNTTVVLVTHDEQMASYGSRKIFLNDGRFE